MFQLPFIHEQYLTGLASFKRSDNPRHFQLIHNASRTGVADTELPLDQRGRSALVQDHQAGCLIEQGIAVGQVGFLVLGDRLAVFVLVFRQDEGARIARLIPDKRGDFLNFGNINGNRLTVIDRMAVFCINPFVCADRSKRAVAANDYAGRDGMGGVCRA